MNDELIKRLKLGRPVDFRPLIHSEKGRWEIVLEDAAYYAQWINPTLTLYRSFETKKIIGCEIFHDDLAELPETIKRLLVTHDLTIEKRSRCYKWILQVLRQLF